ncbi:MAG: YfcE family phosphodiesterase [Thermoprotei archaeon]|nr:MAG: YfcE family phosphodiesterase [Thermoprotei archaeon]
MKLLAVVDIHGNVIGLEKVLKSVESDILVIAGDVAPYRSIMSYRSILVPLSKYSDRFKEILIIPGNMDPEELPTYAETLSSNIHSIHFKALRINNYVFIGAGGSPITPFSTPTEYPDELIENRLRKIFVSVISCNEPIILITHAPPYGTKVDKTYSGIHVGSRGIRRVIEEFKPIINICGHIHESPGTDLVDKTIVINPGPLMRGKYVVVELEKSRVLKIEVARI